MTKIRSILFSSVLLISSVCFGFEDHETFICRLLHEKANQTPETKEPLLTWSQFINGKTYPGEGIFDMYDTYAKTVQANNVAIDKRNSDIQLAAIIHQDRCGTTDYKKIENEYFYKDSDEQPQDPRE